MSRVAVGDKIIYVQDFTNPSSIKEGTVTKIREIKNSLDLCWIDNHHKSEDCIYQHICFPIAAKADVVAAVSERNRLRAAYDDSIKLIYEINNKLARGEYKQ